MYNRNQINLRLAIQFIHQISIRKDAEILDFSRESICWILETVHDAIRKKLRNELRGEMKSMMQQFMESFKIPQAAKTPESNKRPMVNAEAHDSPPSEKRRDVRSSPGKQLFTDVMDLRDSQEYLSVLEATDAPPSPIK